MSSFSNGFITGLWTQVALGFIVGAAVKGCSSDQEVSVSVPKTEMTALKNGNGNPAKVYELFAKSIDEDITAGGQSAKVDVIVGKDTLHIQHVPKAAVVKP